VNEEWEGLLDGKPEFNLWQEQTYLLRLLSTSTIDEPERQAITDSICSMHLEYDEAREIAQSLLINQQHFSNIQNPSQTDIARYLRKISNNI
jgi:hypothetical protein